MMQTSLFMQAVTIGRICVFDLHIIFTAQGKLQRNKQPGMSLFQNSENFSCGGIVFLPAIFITGITMFL